MTTAQVPIGATINFSWNDDLDTPIDGYYVSFQPVNPNTDDHVFYYCDSLEDLQTNGVDDATIYDIYPIYETESENWRKPE